MLPEVSAYRFAAARAESVRLGDDHDLRHAYPAAWNLTGAAREEFVAKVEAQNETYVASLLRARQELLAATEDRLLEWLVQHTFREYSEPSLEIAERLPMSVSDMDELAFENDWCNVYQNFRDRAVAAGVIVDDVPARDRLARLLADELSHDSAEQALSLVDRMVAEARRPSREAVSAHA